MCSLSVGQRGHPVEAGPGVPGVVQGMVVVRVLSEVGGSPPAAAGTPLIVLSSEGTP